MKTDGRATLLMQGLLSNYKGEMSLVEMKRLVKQAYYLSDLMYQEEGERQEHEAEDPFEDERAHKN